MTRKTIALTVWTFVGKVMFLVFNMPSKFVIALLPKSKHLWISWLQSPYIVILECKKIKSVTDSTSTPSIRHEVMGPVVMILVFWMLSFKPTFSISSIPPRGYLVPLHFLPFSVVSSAYLRLLIFFLAILIPAWNSSSLAFHMIYSA